jgi:hypothetical protein
LRRVVFMSFSFVAFVLIRHHRTGSQTVI